MFLSGDIALPRTDCSQETGSSVLQQAHCWPSPTTRQTTHKFAYLFHIYYSKTVHFRLMINQVQRKSGLLFLILLLIAA